MKRMFMVMGLFVLLFTAHVPKRRNSACMRLGFIIRKIFSIPFMTRGKTISSICDGADEMERNEVFAKLKNMATVLSEMGTDKLAQYRCVCHRGV